MTIQLTQGSIFGAALDLRRAPVRMFAVVLIASVLERLRDRLRRAAADLRAAGKRRRLRLQTLRLLDDRIYSELSPARRELEFTYRNNLDRR